MKWVCKNWLMLTVGLILTTLAVQYAYSVRGYIAIGSEWLILPFMFFCKSFARQVAEDVKKWL